MLSFLDFVSCPRVAVVIPHLISPLRKCWVVKCSDLVVNRCLLRVAAALALARLSAFFFPSRRATACCRAIASPRDKAGLVGIAFSLIALPSQEWLRDNVVTCPAERLAMRDGGQSMRPVWQSMRPVWQSMRGVWQSFLTARKRQSLHQLPRRS